MPCARNPQMVVFNLGIRSTNPTADKIWSSVSKNLDDRVGGDLNEADVKRQQSNWPIIMFFAVVFGAPWLIWKLLSRVTGMHGEGKIFRVFNDNQRLDVQILTHEILANKQWITGQCEHYIAVGLYDFMAESDKELSFKAGQSIRLAPKGE